MQWSRSVVLFVFLVTGNMSKPPVKIDPDVCNTVNTLELFRIDEVMGTWYSLEIVQHRQESRLKGSQVTDACPTVYLSGSSSTNELKMLWHEPAGHVEYRFRITDNDNPGFWMSWGPQNGSMLSKPYQQFAGTVQVMKAVQTHLVLTFCSPNQSLYSLILARHNYLAPSEIRGVHNLLNRRGLPQIGVRETCRDSASLAVPALVLYVLSVAVALSAHGQL